MGVSVNKYGKSWGFLVIVAYLNVLNSSPLKGVMGISIVPKMLVPSCYPLNSRRCIIIYNQKGPINLTTIPKS